jgi:RNA polymerase sigma factor (sigma-70 family)
VTPDADYWLQLIAQLELSLLRPAAVADDPWDEMRSQLELLASRLGHAAEIEDAIQTVLLRLQSLLVLERLKASRQPAGYLVVMLRNALRDEYRRRSKPGTLVSWPSADVEDTTAEDVLVVRERRRAVSNALAQLQPAERELLRLRFWKDLSIAQIARQQGLPYSTVAVRMFRLLDKLRRLAEDLNLNA